MKKILVYTDGSCLGNPGPGGWAFLLLEEQNDHSEKMIYKKSGGVSDTTNNRMEMSALLEAAKYLCNNFSSHQIQIFSDSNLLVQTITQGWKKKANQDLWMEIDKFLAKLNFQINWVKAHANNIYNNQCDELALAAAQKAAKENRRTGSKINTKKSPTIKKPVGKKSNLDKSEQASLF